MSFLKKIGGAVGGIFGVRSGQSGQIRQFNEDYAQQSLLKQYENLAQREQFLGQQKMNQFWDQQQQVLEQQALDEARMDATQVALGTAKKRSFFTV